ncbi:T-complex protein 11-like protein 1 isoform X2 [Orussus abietinus]|nr:T-complex protein 11-like protein 1 isoform X2 [Orussus abietinus]
MDNEDEQNSTANKASPSVNRENHSDNEHNDENIKRQRTESASFEGIPSTPPKFLSLEEITRAARGMTNMALAHEIVLDKNFKLQQLDTRTSVLQKQVKEIMHQAFWDILAEQLAETPPNYSQALILLKDIIDSLDELVLPHHKKIRQNMKEVLDVKLIKQQAEQGTLDFHSYANFVISIMSKVCAPVRDEKLLELKRKTNVIDTFKGIMEALQLMRMDLANFTITLMRPSIVASSIEYERDKFKEFLALQTDGLHLTRKWLLKHLDPEKIASVSASDVNAIKQITHCLLAEAYLDLLEWDFTPDAETLMLDQGRLMELRDKTCRACIIGSILLLCAPVLSVTSFKKSLKEHVAILLEPVHSNRDLETVMQNVVLQVKSDIKTMVPAEYKTPELLENLETLIEGQMLDLKDPNHKLRRILSSRIRQFLQKIILSQSAAPQEIPTGLSAMQEELAAIAAQFLILVSHNRSVFDEYYQEIVANAIANGDTGPSNADVA